MFGQRNWGRARISLAALATGTLLTGGLAAPASATPDEPAPPKAVDKADKLGSEDTELLAEAVADGDKTVTVMFVAQKGSAAQARKQVRALGGYVRYSADKLGYFSAVLPTAAVTKAAALDAIIAADLDQVIPLPDVEVNGAAGAAAAGPGATTPDNNPYMPTNETGAIAFRAGHSTWDGRGITIGILDSGIDLAHPALQKTSTGERKITDTFTATAPSEGDGTWRPMDTTVTAADGTFTAPAMDTFPASTWKSPNGTFRFNRFSEASTNVAGSEVAGDVNRDGDKTDIWGILYDPASNDIIIDVDQDLDFTDEEVRRPYSEKFQVGTFGSDNPATDVVEAMPFVVDYKEDVPRAGGPVDYVDIGIVSGAHGSHVAGITAANNMFGGEMDGAAPGANLVSARACSFGPGCTAAALTDGMAELAAKRGVDIINMSIGGLPALNDGNNARAELYNRIINDLGVQIVISAGNSGNALNTIGDPSVATDVVSVGAQISKATWKANYGSDVRYESGMLTFSSGGPREDGGFKPNITAPGSAISTTPTWQPGIAVAEAGYSLPAGYAMFNGTSMASPQAAGAMALLLSAGKQEGLATSNAAALRQAVYSTSVYNPGVPAFLQGHGQINIPAAWTLFRQSLTPDTFTSSAPVCTEIWKILGRTTGTGIYNRCAADAGGQAAGSTRTYPVTITRTSGKAKSGTYALSLRGNDGTFSLGQTSVSLPLNKPVVVPVTATPSEGAHTAILRVDDPKTKGLDFSVMNAVVAAAELKAPTYGFSTSGVSYRNETQRFYVNVPTGTKALQVKLTGLAAGSQTRFLAFHPFGQGVDSTASTACYSNFSNVTACNPSSRSYANPQPGIWEILVESRRTSPLLENPFTLDASLLGVTINPTSQILETVQKGVATPVKWDVTNDFGLVTASAKGGPLGSEKSSTESIGHLINKTYTVEVPTGASRLDVQIGNTSDTGADLDLTVKGPSGTKSSADGDSEEAVSYVNPTAGTYTVTVEGYDVPAGTTTFDYRDVFYAGALGSLSVDSTPFTLANGATHTVTGTVTANQSAAAGRSLVGAMNVTSDSGALLGTGKVTIKTVTE
ncbi:S8 family serine peptidase [Nocardioides sp.]|uniref:S8 family serine peptidase n=1 Tax=Nocardioides sp. TaxID=35761 RepID=UPI002B81EF19|nr:S8 family serine peptidase [Nocardioides sp.]HXH78296.1 S8 family serine peptidase [Nocardioides sp.]